MDLANALDRVINHKPGRKSTVKWSFITCNLFYFQQVPHYSILLMCPPHTGKTHCVQNSCRSKHSVKKTDFSSHKITVYNLSSVKILSDTEYSPQFQSLWMRIRQPRPVYPDLALSPRQSLLRDLPLHRKSGILQEHF